MPRKEHELEELLLIKQSVTDDKKIHDWIHSEIIKLLEVYPSLSSSSSDAISLTKPNIEKVMPELAYTSYSSLDITDLPTPLASCINDLPIISKGHIVEFSNKKYSLFERKNPLHNSLSLSNFEMSI